MSWLSFRLIDDYQLLRVRVAFAFFCAEKSIFPASRKKSNMAPIVSRPNRGSPDLGNLWVKKE